MNQSSFAITRPGMSVVDYIRWLSIAVLVLVGLVYIVNGLSVLLAPGLAGDLGMRWREQTYLRAGIDPYDVSAQFGGLTPSAAEAARIAAHGLAQEAPMLPSGYPPWGFTASFLFIPPASLPMTSVYLRLHLPGGPGIGGLVRLCPGSPLECRIRIADGRGRFRDVR